MKKSGFRSLLQAFVFIFKWKISGFSCVSTKLISCVNRSRLGMCCSEQFITGLHTKMYCCLQKIMYYCLQKIKPPQPAAPKQANSVVRFKYHLRDLGILVLVRMIHGGKNSRLPWLFFWYFLKSVS